MAILLLSEAQDPIAALNKVKSARDARALLGLSLRGISNRITDTTSHDLHHISRSQWCDIESGRRHLRVEQFRQIETVLAEALMNELAYDAMLSDVTRRFVVRITIRRDARWSTKVFTTCVKCQRAYNITRIDSKRCRRCINRSKRLQKGK
jgi:hypothetical protein